MTNIGIKSIQSYLPKKRLTTDELVERIDVKKEFLEKKLGIFSRCIAEDDEASSDLACKAAQKLFEKGCGLKKEDVDLLIVVTQNPDYKLPSTSAIIQHKLGLQTVASFDINLGCSGFIYALAVAKSMMHTMGFSNALVITADIYSKIVSPEDKNTVTLFGDAGTAVWLGKNTSNAFLNFTFGTDGSGFDGLMVKQGGSRFPLSAMDFNTRQDKPLNAHNLYMDGRKIYNFMMKIVPTDIENCLKINNLTLREIDYFVFHQASKFMLDSLSTKLKIPKKKVVFFLKNVGNTVSSSIPLALEYLSGREDLSNKKVLICGFGVGLSWGTSVISYS